MWTLSSHLSRKLFLVSLTSSLLQTLKTQHTRVVQTAKLSVKSFKLYNKYTKFKFICYGVIKLLNFFTNFHVFLTLFFVKLFWLTSMNCKSFNMEKQIYYFINCIYFWQIRFGVTSSCALLLWKKLLLHNFFIEGFNRMGPAIALNSLTSNLKWKSLLVLLIVTIFASVVVYFRNYFISNVC